MNVKELVDDLDSAACEQTLFLAATRFAAKLGFEFCSFSMRMPLPTATRATILFNNHPPAWKSEYLHNNYLAVDPTFKHALHSNAPQIWSDEVFAETPDLWNGAQANGLRVGWTQPCRDARNIVGLLTLARSVGALSSEEISEKQFMLAWLAQTLHHGMTNYLANLYIPSTTATLSDREIDVLRWTAEGKTAREISDILRISDRTVHFHINNVVSKLGVANKTAAAIHAAILGFI